MKIGLFTDGYEPQTSGLIVSVKMLRDELIKLGHVVYVITTSKKNEFDEENKIIHFKGRTIPLKGLDEYCIRRYRKKDRKKLEKLNLDIIHIHTEYSMGKLGFKLAKKMNKPLIYTSHTMVFDYAHYIPLIFRPIGRRIMKKTLKRLHYKSDVVIYPTSKVLKAYEKLIKKDFKYEIIPTGINIEKFENKYSNDEILNLKKKYDIENNKILIYLGRLAEEKSVDVLIKEMVKINDEFKLLIVGDGPHRKKLEKMTNELNLSNRVIFVGMINHDQISLYYRASDIFVNASTSETQGLTYLEALASELSLVVKHDINLDEVLIDKENGRLFYKDHEFSEIINTDKELYKYKDKSLTTAKKFSKEQFADKVLKVYKTLSK